MRNDVTIDRKQTGYLPNTSTLGYGKYKAQFGDVVLFTEANHVRIGRVIGRIKSAPRIGNDPDLRGHLVVLTLGQNLTHAFERWVAPEDVIECFNPEPDKFGGRDVRKLLDFFFGPEFKTKTPDQLRQYANGLTTTEEISKCN